ncbi:MBL fold metallo-hydrolase [Clostridium omnivorum]|uniref:Metallo-beta-lactamase domain-containing protein n=1 Tax=Clostridium omnivorum TaxID=1604902 RepID=A0ABQ5NA47_9CLOT|nr:MBL fold metallo-hydrolase [Clostridium sp. E14]GLC31957.1 hypothetical protein bsdE14_33670 [Clostridium sp. E14]
MRSYGKGVYITLLIFILCVFTAGCREKQDVKDQAAKASVNEEKVQATAEEVVVQPNEKGTAIIKNLKKEDGLTRINDNIVVNTDPTVVKVNSTLVYSGKEAVLIDTGADTNEAKRMKDFIQKNSLKLTNIIFTHYHFDHVSLQPEFAAKDTKLIRGENITDGQEIKVGDKTLRLIKTPGHDEDHDISVEIVDYNILVAGDIVLNCEIPIFNSAQLIPKLKSSLEIIKKKEYDAIIPGHGELIEPRKAVQRNLDYINNLERYIDKIIDKGKSEDEVSKISLEQCLKNSNELDPCSVQSHGGNVWKMYELKKK